jgi:hypothetical protein
MKSMLTNLHNHLHRSLPNPTFYMTLKEFSNAGQNLVIIVNFLITLLELIPLAYNCLFINKVNPSMLYKILVYPRKERKSYKFRDLVEGITLSIGYSGSQK